MFRAPLSQSSGAQEYYKWLLLVVFRAVVFKLLVWCGDEGYVSGLQDAAFCWPGVELRVMCPVCRMLLFAGLVWS